jgi:hypothetical protein
VSFAIDHGSHYTFESIALESERTDMPIDIKRVTTDVDIFEHMDKPYLTGTITLLDNANFYAGTDILGGEKITIIFKSTRENTKEIKKVFYVSKVLNTNRVNDTSVVIRLQILEDIAYQSNLINVNKSYNGKVFDILQKIGKNYLNKSVGHSAEDKQSIKVIVPNMSPLEAMMWLKNRATTKDGYPYYLYSSLTDDYLSFADLGSLVSQTPINGLVPYVYSEAASQLNTLDKSRKIIQSYDHKNAESLYDLIRNGLIGSKYEYINLLDNERKSFNFDIVEDLLRPLIRKGVLTKDQQNPMYTPEFTLNDKPFNTLQSKNISRIGGISAFKNGTNNNQSYSESNSIAEYKLQVMSYAMHNLLQKSPMTIYVNGIDFIDGNYSTTIGNVIKLVFPKSRSESHPLENNVDPKLSGNYLIFAARHMIKKEKYDIALSCVKLANYSRKT